MARSTRKLDELAALLERTGGDPQRLDAVRRAQNFRRSWIDLAEALAGIRSKRAFERWGYDDFYKYCSSELTLKRATVDKLTMSYSTLRRHAPQVLEWDGVAKTIPSYEAIDYFGRVVDDDEPANDAAPSRRGPPARRVTPERVEALTQAVFDEGKAVGEIRKQFDPVFFPRPKGSDELATLRKAAAMASKLAELLPDVNGLPKKQVRELEKQLGQLRVALEELAAPVKERVDEQRKRERARAKKRRKSTPAGQAGDGETVEGDAATSDGKKKAPPRAKAPRVRTTGA